MHAADRFTSSTTSNMPRRRKVVSQQAHGGAGGRVVSVQEVQKHQSPGDLWVVIHGKVYDVSHFMDEHPGGSDVLMDVAGTVRWHSPLHSWCFSFVDVLAHAVALSTLPTLRWRWRWGHQEPTHPKSTSTSCVLQQLPRFDVNHLANPLGWGAC